MATSALNHEDAAAPPRPLQDGPTPAAPPPGSANIQEWTTFVLPAVIAVIIIAVWLRRRRREPGGPN